MKLSFILVTFASIFTIVNPLGAIPTFLTHANDWTAAQMKATARKSSTVMAIVLIAFAFTGTYVFQLMNITMPAFQIAGGILLFSTGFEMMKGAHQRRKLTDEDRREAEMKEDISVIPLAIPLLSGPGAITAVIVLMGQNFDVLNASVVVIGIIATAIVTYIIFSHAQHLFKILGPSGVRVMNRIFGLILSAISVQFVIDGVEGTLPTLLRFLGK